MATAREIVTDLLPKKISSNPALATAANAVYCFDVAGANGGTWTLDLTKKENHVSDGKAPQVQCTLKLAEADLVSMWEKKASPEQLFMQGKLKIDPPSAMGLSLKIKPLIT